MFAYTQENGNVAICRTKAGVPSGTSYIEVESVPDRKYRDAWRIVGNEVVMDSTISANVDSALDKEGRMEQMETLIVTTVSGNVFDADKPALAAITQAVTLGDPGEVTNWKMADNTVVAVTWEELREAGRLAGVLHTQLIAV